MWGINMPHVEHREAERRVKAWLFSSMVGVLVGLIVATCMEAEHRAPPSPHPMSGLNDPSNEPKEMSNGNASPKERTHAEYSPG